MGTKEDFIEKLDRLVLTWKKQGIKLNKGISNDDLRKLESDFSFSFEPDFHAYLKRTNGFKDFDSDEAWFSFWSVDRIIEENKDNSHPKEVIWFSDHCINLCSFGFHKIAQKVYIHFQTMEEIECIADSFSDFIDTYLQDPFLLLR